MALHAAYARPVPPGGVARLLYRLALLVALLAATAPRISAQTVVRSGGFCNKNPSHESCGVANTAALCMTKCQATSSTMQYFLWGTDTGCAYYPFGTTLSSLQTCSGISWSEFAYYNVYEATAPPPSPPPSPSPPPPSPPPPSAPAECIVSAADGLANFQAGSRTLYCKTTSNAGCSAGVVALAANRSDTLSGCAAACDSAVGCAGFSFNSTSACQLQSSGMPTSDAQPSLSGACFNTLPGDVLSTLVNLACPAGTFLAGQSCYYCPIGAYPGCIGRVSACVVAARCLRLPSWC
jgi:hypothetical protein